MKTLKEHCGGKVSAAIIAMCDGLVEQDKRPDFAVNMNYFGMRPMSRTDLCYGCAATCAAQKLSGVNLTAGHIAVAKWRAQAMHLDEDDLEKFETAIDKFRRGYVRDLFNYFDATPLAELSSDEEWRLTNDSWERQLPEIRQYAAKLERLGL